MILQGVLGGLTVLFFLPAAISTAHAGLAQIFLLSDSDDRAGHLSRLEHAPCRGWWTTACRGSSPDDIRSDLRADSHRRDDAARRCGLAIQTFLSSSAGWYTALDAANRRALRASRPRAGRGGGDLCNRRAHIWFHHADRRELRRLPHCSPPGARANLLGGLIVLTKKDVAINTGMSSLARSCCGTSLLLTLRSHRVRFEDSAVSRARGRRRRSGARSIRSVTKKIGRVFVDAFEAKRLPILFVAGRNRLHRPADFFSLTKPRLNFLSSSRPPWVFPRRPGHARPGEMGEATSAPRWWPAVQRD